MIVSGVLSPVPNGSLNSKTAVCSWPSCGITAQPVSSLSSSVPATGNASWEKSAIARWNATALSPDFAENEVSTKLPPLAVPGPDCVSAARQSRLLLQSVPPRSW